MLCLTIVISGFLTTRGLRKAWLSITQARRLVLLQRSTPHPDLRAAPAGSWPPGLSGVSWQETRGKTVRLACLCPVVTVPSTVTVPLKVAYSTGLFLPPDSEVPPAPVPSGQWMAVTAPLTPEVGPLCEWCLTELSVNHANLIP